MIKKVIFVFLSILGLIRGSDVPIIFIHGHKNSGDANDGWETWYPSGYSTAMKRIINQQYREYRFGLKANGEITWNCDKETNLMPMPDTKRIFNFSYYHPDGGPGVISLKEEETFSEQERKEQTKIPFWKKLEFSIGYSGGLFYTKRDFIPFTSLGIEPGYPWYWLNALEITINYPLKGFDKVETGLYIEGTKFKKYPFSLKDEYSGAPGRIILLNIAPFVNFLWNFENGIILRIGGIFFYCWGEEKRKIYKKDAEGNKIFIGDVKIKGKGHSKEPFLEVGKLWKLNFWVNTISLSVGIRGGGIEYYSDWYQFPVELDLSGIYIVFRFKFMGGKAK